MIYPARSLEAAAQTSEQRVDHEIDERLHKAERCLRDCNYPALHAVDCSYHNGVITLRGQVPSYYMKQVAQELASKASRVEIANCLEVTQPARQ
jgi:osmotically-inducible protein OsmY